MALHSRSASQFITKSMIMGMIILTLAVVTPAQAAPVFSQMTGDSNPFNGVDLGNYTTPALGDLDGDGDLDALISADNGSINYYKNTGDAYAPVFTAQTGTANPFNGVVVGSRTTIALADIDSDGDLDAFIGFNEGNIKFYRNDGTAYSPSFTVVTGTSNPFNIVDVGTDSSLTLGDIDSDGDLDAFFGASSGSISFYRNDGTATAPSFTLVSGTGNPLNGVTAGSESRPMLADVDRDGDLDVILGGWEGYNFYYRNIGTAIAPSYSNITGSNNPFYSIDVGNYSTPALGDIDRDGDLDAFFGDYDGTIYFYSNGDSPTTSNFSEATGSDYPFDIMSFPGSVSIPALGDIDGDGDLDVFAGFNGGSIIFYRNDGSAIIPNFTAVTDSGNPFSIIFGLQNSAPTLGDVDGDGDLDAFVGVYGGNIIYYRNDGTATTPSFTEITDENNPFYDVTVGTFSTPSMVDVDGDGDLDAFIGGYDGTVTYYQNTGTVITPTFSLVSDSNNPFDGVDVGMKSALTLADVDNDGDLDSFIGEYNGTLIFYQNIGTVITPTYNLVTGWDNPFNGVDVGVASAPVLGNFDSDGDLDAIVGEYAGPLNYYHNALPEMAVIGNDQVIADGDTSPMVDDDSDFGYIALGETITHTFTISNTGAGNLNLTGTSLISLSSEGASYFSVVSQPTNPVVYSGSSTFKISFSPSVTTTQVATVTITNNDSDENPYDFAIQGSTGLPEMAVIGNGQEITDGDAMPGTADDTDFGVVIPGITITHTFTISNSGSANLQLTGLPLVSLSGDGAGDFSVVVSPTTSVDPLDITTFQISFTPSVTSTRVATVTIANNDSDENPYDFAIQGIMGLPEMAVIGNGQEIVGGDSTPDAVDDSDFGNLRLGESVTHTFTILNSGNAALILNGSPAVSLGGAGAIDFNVVAQPVTPIASGAPTTFQIRFAPSITVTQAATVTIVNNDSDENPYQFAIQGNGIFPDVIFTPAQFSIAEGGSRWVSATLGTQPDNDVTITLSNNNPDQCTVSPVLVTLNETNWQSGVGFVVNGVIDGASDGSQVCTIITSLVSNDSFYNGFDPADIIVTVTDWNVSLPMIFNAFGSNR